MSRSSSKEPEGADQPPTSRLVAAELPAIALVLIALGGTLALLIAAYKRPAIVAKPAAKSNLAIAHADLKPAPISIPKPKPKPKPKPTPPSIAVEDPTAKELARLDALSAEELAKARADDERTEALERARNRALAAIDRRKKREFSIKKNAEMLTGDVDKLLTEADQLAIERDVLSQEIEATKKAAAKRAGKTSYAIMPYRGANGTWRRPIAIECRADSVVLQPTGPAYTLADLKNASTLGINPLLTDVARTVMKVQGSRTPDGAPGVPYIVFIIRADGILSYYAARSLLQRVPIAFGYELVDQNVEIDFLNPGAPSDWDDGPSLKAFPGPTVENGIGNGSNPNAFGIGSSKPGGVGFGPFNDAGGNSNTAGNGSGSRAGGAPNSRYGSPLGSGPGSGQAPSGFGRGPSTRGFDPRKILPAQPNLNVPDGRTLAALARGENPAGLPPTPPGRIALPVDGSDDDDLPPTPNGSGGTGFRRSRDYSQNGATGDQGTSSDSANRPRRGFGRWSKAIGGSGGGMNGSGNNAGGTLAQNGPNGTSANGSTSNTNGTFANGSPAAGGSAAAYPSPTPANSGAGTTADPANLDGNTVAPADLPTMQPADPARLANQNSGGGMNGSGNNAGGTLAQNGPNGTSANGSTSHSGGTSSNATSANGSTSTNPSRTGASTTADPGNLDGNTVAPADVAATQPADPARLANQGAFAEPSEGSSLNQGGTASTANSNSSSSNQNTSTSQANPNNTAASSSSTKPMFNLGSPGSAAASASPGMPSLGMNMGQQNNNSGAATTADKPVPRSERDFEVVVVCDRDGVVVQPGMTRLNMRRLQGNDADLERRLRAVVLAKRRALPNVDPKPSVRFLIEAGGQAAYWEARRQTLVSGLNWPVTVQVAEGGLSATKGTVKR